MIPASRRSSARRASLPRGLLLFFVALAAGCGTGCDTGGGTGDTVRRWLAEAEAAAEEGDRAKLMGLVAERYADARGNDRDDIDRMLRLVFLRSQKIMLASKIDELSVIGNTDDATAASVLLTVGMAGTDSNILGLTADAYRFELELEAHGGDWRLIGARWGEVGQPLR